VPEGLDLLAATEPMVSHMILLVDAHGEAAVAERAPGAPLHARRGRGKLPLTNHFEGPLADDPENRRILGETSTRARRARLDELLANLPAGASVEAVVGVLRDKKGIGGSPLALGDRRAIDALIATHAVVMDATARALWVSEGPHLAGRFVRFDLRRLLDPGHDPLQDSDAIATIPEDPILQGGEYEAWRRAGSPHPGGALEGAPPDATHEGEE
jgi:hypothetical protein